MQRGVFHFTHTELQYLSSLQFAADLNLNSKLQDVGSVEPVKVELSEYEVESIIDLLPPPTTNPTEVLISDLRKRLTEFLFTLRH